MGEYFLNDLAAKVTDLMEEFNEDEDIPELFEEMRVRIKNKFYDLIAELTIADLHVWETRGFRLKWIPMFKVLKEGNENAK